MARKGLNVYRLGFHIAAVIYHIFISYYVNFELDFSKSTSKYTTNLARFSWRFYTTWNFIVQTYYFIMCLTNDVLEMLTETKELATIKTQVGKVQNYTFCTFAFPLAFSVSILFWVLFTVDRSFVSPVEFDKVMPPWVNHALHTNIVMFILLEQIVTFHSYPTARKQALTVLSIFLVIYKVCYISTYVIHGVWLYPIHDMLNWTQRILLAVAMYGITCGCYMLGEGINSKIWENEIQMINGRRNFKMSNKLN